MRENATSTNRRRRSFVTEGNRRPPRRESERPSTIVWQGRDTVESRVEVSPVDAILVFGLTGVGKSTFISRLTQSTSNIGHSLTSCTKDVEGHLITRSNGQQIYLIDTPGFDDTEEDDAQFFSRLAILLYTFYERDCIHVKGMLYLHRISDVRMSGSSIKSLRFFEKMCGEGNFPAVVVVTTMWKMTTPELGAERERSLESMPEFFGRIINGGGRMIRHDNTPENALKIFELLASRHGSIVLDVQKEMVDEGMPLIDTAAGRCLMEDSDNTRARYETQLKKLKEALKEAEGEEEDDIASTISENQKEYEEHLRKESVRKENLSLSIEQMNHQQSRWCTQRYEEAMAEAEQKTAREVELEEQLERTEIDHMRQMKKLRLEKRDKDVENEELKRLFEQLEQEKTRRRGRKAEIEAQHIQAVQGSFISLLRKAIGIAPVLPRPQRASTFPFEPKASDDYLESKPSSAKERRDSPRRRKHSRKKHEKVQLEPEDYYSSEDGPLAETAYYRPELRGLDNSVTFQSRSPSRANASPHQIVYGGMGPLRRPEANLGYVPLRRSYTRNDEYDDRR